MTRAQKRFSYGNSHFTIFKYIELCSVAAREGDSHWTWRCTCWQCYFV